MCVCVNVYGRVFRVQSSICMDAWLSSKSEVSDVRIANLIERAHKNLPADEKTNAKDDDFATMYKRLLKASVHCSKFHQTSIPRGIQAFRYLLEQGKLEDDDYGHIFLVCQRMGKNEKTTNTLLTKAMKQCQMDGQLSAFALGTFLRSAPPHIIEKLLSEHTDQKGRDARQGSWNPAGLEPHHLPKEWSRNVNTRHTRK